jgi:hypothetical protein
MAGPLVINPTTISPTLTRNKDGTITTPSHAVFSINQQGAQATLYIEEELMVIQSRLPMPNKWKRFWYKFLLGWEWKKEEK